GEDLLRESVPQADAVVAILTGLGFGQANVVVAVPQAWIDVRSMADLDEVAGEMRARRDRKLRVATKYLNLTRRFFAEKGLADYRIVESLGATEGAPASGAADLIVDITTTGATLAANGLRVLDDGVILRSEANLMASLRAPWGPQARRIADTVLGRIAAEEAARRTREVRAGIRGFALDLAEIERSFAATVPSGRPAVGEIVLHCPVERTFALVDRLMAAGAEDVTVRSLDYVFRRRNALATRLFDRLAVERIPLTDESSRTLP
ncbi:MAG: ATP phosphoribosyltransferase, partial [Methylobacteriaceae bacterium]|nr:ATP phosphoribosyltransferase [Methylobacteriaceae bacterium]